MTSPTDIRTDTVAVGEAPSRSATPRRGKAGGGGVRLTLVDFGKLDEAVEPSSFHRGDLFSGAAGQ